MKPHFIIKKTVFVGAATLLSRLIGLVRDLLFARYLGAGALAEAFFAAYHLPNSLRKIFAEGALSASSIPSLVFVLKHEGQRSANRLMTLLLIVVVGLLAALCCGISLHASAVINFIAPGWQTACAGEAARYASLSEGLLSVLIFFIIFLSVFSLLSGALQVVGYFVTVALGQVVLNLLLVIQLFMAIWFQFSVMTIAYAIIANGALLVVLYSFLYQKSGFSYAMPNRATWQHLAHISQKFLPCLVTVGALELNLLIDGQLISFLPSGGRSILYYASAYMRIPLGMIAVAFSSIVLPFLSRLHARQRHRFSFYIVESAKFLWWIMFPAAIVLAFFAEDIFSTMLRSTLFTDQHVVQAAAVLRALLFGLFFFSFNKLLLSVFYAVHSTIIPTIITLCTTVCNTLVSFILMKRWGISGIAFATSLSGAFQTVLLLYMLRKKYGFHVHGSNFFKFFWRYTQQIVCVSGCFYVLYKVLVVFFKMLSPAWSFFLTESAAMWLWCIPLMLAFSGVIYISRTWWQINGYFFR